MSSGKGWVSALFLVSIAFVSGCPEEEGSEGIGRLGVRSLCEQTGDPFWCELLGIPTGPGQTLPDTDGDGIIDAVDNCPATANADQSDCDGDEVGDACAGEPDCNANNVPDSCDIAAARVRTAREGARVAPIGRGNAPIDVLWWDSTPEYGGQAADALRQAMSDFLDSFDGGTVFDSTYVSSEVPGTLATHMLSNSYDVIVFDATSGSAKFDADDLVAVQAHFLNHPSVLLDGILYIRSIIDNDTSVFPGINGSSGAFTANEVFQLGVRGGGIMVGTDHQGFQVDANQIVDAIVPGAAFTGITAPSLDGQFNGDDLLDAVAIVSPFDLFTHWSSIGSEAIAPTGDFTDFFGRSVTLSSQVDVADAPGGGPRFSYIATSWAPQGTALEFDCNGNDILDGIDIAGGTSTDCDANFVPDECDPDCDGNGEPDGCEIIDDAALDCDGNNIMDECEIEQDSGLDGNGNSVLDACESVEIFSADCNGNGVLDECELDGNDCNNNAVPDDCELAGNDCEGNGVPDECEEDCNGDQTPDDCPAELEPGQDCNGNDLPDCHDIAGGTSSDCNGNSIPDECDIVDGQVRAGSIFLTGHDPDFHASLGGNATGARNINSAAINFVMNPVFNPFVEAGADKFLFVEAKIAAPSGHTNGVNGIVAGGYADGVDFDHHDASTLDGALNDLGAIYGAIVVASDFGGVLTQAELDILNTRSADIIGFLNQGGGLYAMSESNGGVGLTPDGGHYAFLPFVVSSTAFDQTEVGIAVTDFGASLGLTNTDVNGNASHAIFVEESGLSIVDVDQSGNILSLAARGVFDPDAGLVRDCNDNQVPDECDIAEGTSTDCNGNGTPDECELGEPPIHDCCETGHGAGCSDAQVEACVCAGDTFCCSGEWDSDCVAEVETFACGLCGSANDCNGNGTLDECDVASGTSADCNGNNTPDECDVAGGTGADCNGNDFLDACDIETGTSQDCNGNGIPDVCDVAGIAAIRISQESSAGQGDFDQNVLGFLQPFETTLSAFDYYRYSLGSAASFNGTEPTLTAERSHLFLVQATDGLSLFVVHDIPGNADGGSANTQYELSGDPDGVFRSAEDDPGEGYSGAAGESVFAANHSWSTCCTDGLALTGLDGDWSMLVDFTTSVSGLNSWAAYAPNADPISLELAPNRRVRLDVGVQADASDCNGNSIPDECDVDAGDADDSDGDQVLDECESCPFEPALLQPQDTFETDCGDGIDNDCDGLTDSSDDDCE